MKTEQEDSQRRESAIRQGTTVGDLHEHIHLENNILFPNSVKKEDDMIRRDRKQ